MQDGKEIKKRSSLVNKFYRLILEPNEYPPSPIYDDDDVEYVLINVDGESDPEYKLILEKIANSYGVKVKYTDLWMYFWEFLDYLESEQERQKTQKLLPKPE